MQTDEVERIAQLLIKVADERPAVLVAIRDLLLAIDGATSTRSSTTTSDTATSEAIVAEPESATGVSLDLTEGIPSESTPAPQAPAPTPYKPEDEAPASTQSGWPTDDGQIEAGQKSAHDQQRTQVEPNERDLASLEALKNLFNQGATKGGIAPVDNLVDRSMRGVRPPYAREAEHAAFISRLASAQARRLRRLRKSRSAEAGAGPPATLLNKHSIEDWTADPQKSAALDTPQLKIGESWYALTARAFAVLEEWFEGHPATTLGPGHRDELTERLAAAALAQKGLHCWLARAIARQLRAIGICGVQQRAFEQIRSWAKHPGEGGFGIYLATGLRLDQEVETEERKRIEHLLEQLELEHAPKQSVDQSNDHRESPDDGSVRSRGRFDSVAEAFEAAAEAFGDLLVFTDRAGESAERSHFVRPDEVYEVFEVMHGIARDLRSGSLDGTPLEDTFAHRGHRKKPCSKSTMRRHRRFYHMEFDGKLVDLSEHITLGSRNQNTCLSIHWWHDQQHGRFVIGHCGKHLPNTMT